jgi:hypothetical protein
MDRLEHYQKAIIEILEENNTKPIIKGQVERQLWIDKERNHFQLLTIGWNGEDRIYSSTMHFDIIDGKIWIQRNTTDSLIAQDLVKKGIPKEDIVLGLQPPTVRKYTEYASVI